MTTGDTVSVATVYFGVGGNLGDRLAHVQHAVSSLGTICADLATSAIFETPPWGDRDQPSFLNLVVRGTTMLTPSALLVRIKEIEYEVGRRPTRRWGPRVIDIDILAYGNSTVTLPDLDIPHVRLHERAFVLVPLADLEPDWRHPTLGTTAQAMVGALPIADTAGVVRVGPSLVVAR